MDLLTSTAKGVREPAPRRTDVLDDLEIVEEVIYRTPLFHGGDWARCVTSAFEGTYILTAVATISRNKKLSGRIVVHEAKTGEFLCTLQNHGNHGYSDVRTMACFGSYVVAGDGLGIVCTYDFKTGDCLSSVQVTKNIPISSVAVVKDVALLVATVDGDLMIFDLKDGKVGQPRWVYEIHAGQIWSIATYEDTVVTTGEDWRAKQWNVGYSHGLVTHLVPINTWRHKSAVRCAAVGKRWIATAGFNEVQLRRRFDNTAKIKVSSPQIITNLHPGHWIHSIDLVSGKGKIITAGGDGVVVVYDIFTREPSFRVDGDLRGFGRAIWDAEMLPMGRIAITGWDDNSYIIDCRLLWNATRQGSMLSSMMAAGGRVWKRTFLERWRRFGRGSTGGDTGVPRPAGPPRVGRIEVFTPQDSVASVDVLAEDPVRVGDTGGMERNPTGVSALTKEEFEPYPAEAVVQNEPVAPTSNQAAPVEQDAVITPESLD